ncbi:potassium channel family protein [Streptomyces sp. DSM 44915]|uniref:Potassium channel family protein n=1 Tax=Streptomyces chisholmiae TaxID=3075540 RepID=A0ABU2JKG3_9ACTN|nr:potassium channel family protein [Streptomyces sp. DSM 44915]MDT0265228.1 potassium channel family protein [Streptomyces sp. DSM 44915]
MFGFVVLAAALATAGRAAWRQPSFRGAALSLLTVLATGTVFYQVHERWSLLDSLYFAVTTGLTIGYGDLAPTTTLSRVFTMLYAASAVSLFAMVGGLLARIGLTQRQSRRGGRPPESP